MSGARSGVSTQITNIEPRALTLIAIYGHALNLATQDAIKENNGRHP